VLHHDQLLEHGGLPGIRDENVLESALARPIHRWHYEGTRDLVALAAVYAIALTTGHPYVDGNKRIGFIATAAFLDLNGLELEVENVAVVRVMRRVAAGEASEVQLARWVRDHLL
jgi:death-on-curing protein